MSTTITEKGLYHRYRARRMRAGTWNRPVDIDTVREHLDKLHRGGMTTVAIGAAANLSHHTIYGIISTRDRRYVEGDTAAAILAVQPSKVWKAGHTDPTGTVRRLRALVCVGYSFADLGRSLGTNGSNVCSVARGHQESVTVATAEQVRALYEALSDTDGPSVRARNLAKRDGWVPPLGWVDVDIDDPDAEPYQDIVDEYAVSLVVARQRNLGSLISYAEKQAAVAALRDRDLDDKAIALHVDTTPSVVRMLLNDLDPATRRRCGVCGGPVRSMQPTACYCRPECYAEGNRRSTAASKARRRTQEATA